MTSAHLPPNPPASPSPWDAGATPPAGPSTHRTPQAARRKGRPHPAKSARTAAAAISAGSFLGITGLLIAQHGASATGSTSTSTSTAGDQSTSAASDSSTGASSSTSNDSWAATSSSQASTAQPATTTHGS